MANISTYPITTPKAGDLLVGSETYDSQAANPTIGNPTRNFTVSSIISSQIPNYINGTVNTIPVFTAANKIGDSIITQDIDATTATITGGLTVTNDVLIGSLGGNLTVNNESDFKGTAVFQGNLLDVRCTMKINNDILDVDNLSGTAGQVLSSTGDNVKWIDAASGTGTVESITALSPLTGGTITTTGDIGITQATTSTDGYLSSTDWNTFNNKQSTSEKGQADGYAPLNENNKVPTVHLPDSLVGAVVYQGTWDATNNIPELPVPAAGNNGHYYIVSDAGTYSGITYAVGDWIISNGIAWEKVDNTQDVNSVFGRQGNIVAVSSDYAEFYDANVQSDWSVVDNTSDAFILNKPTIPTDNSQLANGAGYTTNLGTVLGSGTALFLPYWTNSNTLGDSPIAYSPSNNKVSFLAPVSMGDTVNFQEWISLNSTLLAPDPNNPGDSTPGISGQVLSSTGTGVRWIDNTVTGTVTGTGTTNKLPLWTDGPNSVLSDSGFYQSPPTAILTMGAVSLNTTFSDTNFGEVPGLRVASRVANTPGVIDLFRNDTTVTTGESVGILQYSVLDDGRYAVAQIGVETLTISGSGDSGGGKFLFKTAKGGGSGPSQNTPESRFTLDYNSADFLVPISAIDITASGTTTLESNIIATLPSFADDAAASSLAQGRLYQTDGTGAAPLNVAGIVMRKQ